MAVGPMALEFGAFSGVSVRGFRVVFLLDGHNYMRDKTFCGV